jgi:hypothetical protein
MGREARCSVSGLPGSGTALLRVTGGVWNNNAVPPVLSVTCNGRLAGARTVSADVGHCLFPVELSNHLDILLSLDRTFSVPGDVRSLGLMVRGVDFLPLDDLQDPLDDEGWFDWEDHEYFPFRWMGIAARLVVPPRVRERGGFAQLPVSSDCPDGQQLLSVSDGQRFLTTLRLLKGWHVYDLPLEPEACEAEDRRAPQWLSFQLNRLAPSEVHPRDSRALGVRVGPLEVHGDRRRHEYVTRFHAAVGGATSDEVSEGSASRPAARTRCRSARPFRSPC